ncbi:hypothetical protein Trydic_g3809 [Trypoxylus dichotomus]
MQADRTSFTLLQQDTDCSISYDKTSDRKNGQLLRLNQKDNSMESLLDTDSDEDAVLGKGNNIIRELPVGDTLSHVNGIRQRMQSAGPSGKQAGGGIELPFPHERQLSSSESDSDISEKKSNIPGEYDPNCYQDLNVTNEIKDLFQYIVKYIPQNLNLDFKFKPFIPDYIPAVGDIDAFLKVKSPAEYGLDNKKYDDVSQLYLGLTVLDEPSIAQSDPALLHLKLRASAINVNHAANIFVKKIGNVEKNSRAIDKWIKDITDLHRSKTSPVVKYTDNMPDIEDLMQAWPEKMETLLKVHGFPNHRSCPSLNRYIDVVCCMFNIPIYKKNRVQSLHLLFGLYAAIKNSQLYKASKNIITETQKYAEKKYSADQLILE